MARELDLFEHVAVVARKMPEAVFTEPDDDWAPIMFLDGPKGRATTPLSEFMEDDLRKDMLTSVLIPALIDEFRATTVVMVISTWVSETASQTYTKTGEYRPPSTQADREERVLIVEYTREGVTRQSWAPIIRFPDKVPQLGEWSDLEAVGISGRFVDPIVNALKEVAV